MAEFLLGYVRPCRRSQRRGSRPLPPARAVSAKGSCRQYPDVPRSGIQISRSGREIGPSVSVSFHLYSLAVGESMGETSGTLYRWRRVFSCDSVARACASQILNAFPRGLRTASPNGRSTASCVQRAIPAAAHRSASRRRIVGRRYLCRRKMPSRILGYGTRVGSPAQSRAGIKFCLAQVPYVARGEFSAATVRRGGALQSKWKRSLAAYGLGQPTAQQLRQRPPRRSIRRAQQTSLAGKGHTCNSTL